ncbi:MAG TPA: hypothetical protein VNT75_21060 [Symbiobacteriaceae bacterium]|nr:hypothetical protein [Symbiobacteriaceae bacterium]
MEKRPPARNLRVRRTLTPGEVPARPLARALWGVAAADANLALDEQRQAFTAEAVSLDEEIRRASATVEHLSAEVDRQKRRLQSLRDIVRVLREKLAHERAARAVLATRLLDRQAAEQQALTNTRLETVRLSADVQQEHEALRQLVSALYRSIAGRQGVPANLGVLAEIPRPTTGSMKPAQPWHRFLTGKKAGRALQTPDGRVILQEGETIGPDELAAAEREGLLFELILSAKVVERLPDL